MGFTNRFRARRRPGISNLVGAVFFVLIVGLVLSTLVVMFTASSGYIGGIHTSNEVAQQGSGTSVKVSGLAFGGELAKARVSIPVNGSLPQPILPVTNMNFTSGMQGWYTSTSYPNLYDTANVTNALQSNGSAYIEQTTLHNPSNPETFVLTITNLDALGSSNDTAKVSLLVDTYFTSVAWGTCLTPLTCSAWSLNAPVGNNLTIVPNVLDQLVPKATAQITWTADVPQTLGTYYDTVVLYWHSGLEPSVEYSDYGTVTVSTTIATPLPSPLLAAAPVTLSPRTPGIAPGGLTAGYDSTGLTTASGSDFGSAYLNFEPSFSGQPLPAGQELSGGVIFTSPFPLTQAEICQLRVTFVSGPCVQVCPSNCFMTASMAASLDQARSVPNPLVYYHLELVNPSGTVYVINQGGTDPTTVNHFSASGWQETNTQFSPPASFWVPGTYKLEVVVNSTVPGGAPSEVSMHFDNVGLALNLETPAVGTGGSAYGSSVIPLSFTPPVSYNQAQQVSFALNMSLGSSPTAQTFTDTLAYVYAAATPVTVLGAATPVTWYEVASVTFNGSASAGADIQLPAATGFIDSAGELQVKVVAISVGSGVACQVLGSGLPNCDLLVSAYAVSTTLGTPQATTQAVFTITDPQSGTAVQLVSLFMSGPNGTLPASAAIGDSNGVTVFPMNNYLTAGSTVVLYGDLASQNFAWIPGQVYEVTVVSSAGVSYSSSFTAP